MSEYPDHLNPFKDSEKKKLGKTLTRSFRELKGFLRQSFRKKKTKSSKYPEFEDVQIRRSYDTQSYNTLRNNVLSLPSPPTYSTYTSPPLPRSRFKERLSRSSLNDTFDSTYDERCNPFAEEGLNPFEDPPVPYRRRRSKKRAPIPTTSSNPDVNYGFKNRGSSKWSLTSSETDYTIDDKSEYSGDVTYSHSLRECLDNFNKEMDSLNKGSIEMGGSSPNILAGTKTKILEETEYTTKSEDVLTSRHSREINNNVSGEQNGYKNEADSADEGASSALVPQEHNNDQTEIHLEQQDSNESERDDINGNHIEEELNNSQSIGIAIMQEETGELERDHEEVIVYTETKDIEDKNEFRIDEIKLAYIDQESAIPEQNGSENIEDNYSKEPSPIPEQNGSENPEDNYSKEPSPIPKLRKIKLDKDALLGDPISK